MSLGRLLVRTSLIFAAVCVVVVLLIVLTEDAPEAVALEELLHEHDGEPESFLQ